MTVKSRSALITQAQEIRDETTTNANTASRVGTMDEDSIDSNVIKHDYDANTILQATADNTPVAITIAEQRILGRITGGNITALTGAQIRTLLVLAESDSVKFLDVDATELSNKSGGLKIQPDAQGDVELFGDTDVGDASDGKSLTIHRRAAEADDSFILFIDQFQSAQLKSTQGLRFRSENGGILFDLQGSQTIDVRNTSDSFKTKFKILPSVNGEIRLYGLITAAAADKYISWKVDDATDQFILDREDANILGFKVNMPLEVVGEILQTELSADPSDPPEGQNVTWQSDGTGSGDDGDIMMKITAGATTKTITLVDFSAS